MKTVSEAIRQILPDGSNGDGGWDDIPRWPPDLFAVVGYIAQQSDCYTILVDWSEVGSLGNIFRDGTEAFEKSGKYWRDAKSWHEVQLLTSRDESPLRGMWKELTQSNCELSKLRDNYKTCWNVLSLLVVADTACKGIGFEASEDNDNWVALFMSFMQQGIASKDIFSDPETYFSTFPTTTPRHSKRRETCSVYAAEHIVCVHPKSRTPSVGCTLRSLTHHVSLHPPSSRLKSYWFSSKSLKQGDSKTLDMLLLPIPYRLEPGSIEPCASGNKKFQEFEVKQGWLSPDKLGSRKSEEELTIEAICDAYRDAGARTGYPEVIVCPELSLNRRAVDAVIRALLVIDKNLSLILVVGILNENKVSGSANEALTTVVSNGKKTLQIGQAKHHRWRLTRDQIKSYGLTRDFPATNSMALWERHSIAQREINYIGFSQGSCLATLICEDLARTEPCQQSLRAVGPNLVIALLMDGPQLEQRWPGRYATTLADDPGSSVLTLTSLALIDRSNDFFGSSRRTIALWKDSTGESKEIELPHGAIGVVLRLSRNKKEEHTLDGRSDGKSAQVWSLDGISRVERPNK